jgi:hypothetical protein
VAIVDLKTYHWPKSITNSNNANKIEMKVDARSVTNTNTIQQTIVDFSSMEIAKSLKSKNKVFNGRYKLAIETKCALDNLVTNCDPNTLNKLSFLNIPVFNIQEEVCRCETEWECRYNAMNDIFNYFKVTLINIMIT